MKLDFKINRTGCNMTHDLIALTILFESMQKAVLSFFSISLTYNPSSLCFIVEYVSLQCMHAY